MKTQRELAEDLSPETLERASNKISGMYEGKIEIIHESYKDNGLIKVRVPILHEDWPIDRIPWARLNTFLRCACWEWDNPSPMHWSGGAYIKATGTIKEEGSIKFEGDLTGTVSITDPGSSVSGPATGDIIIEGDYESEGEVELEVGDSEEGYSGSISMTITPSRYHIFPWRKIRSGEGLIRIGDRVLVTPVNNDERNLIVVDLII